MISLAVFLLYSRYRKTWPQGRFVGIIIAFGMSWRFLTEFFKENQVAFEEEMVIHMGQILSLAMFFLGVYLIFMGSLKKSSN